ncbi:glycoside hydrolase family 2 protein [Vibrio gallicus]|uniref:glycoside hydrolase family 2 protein n=1 Tax=Vibrio gallicus TaxID=190897 RepID=UPI0021C2A85D|nr:glycoside hydrolase family 2 protein [Vibrio gallicus]
MSCISLDGTWQLLSPQHPELKVPIVMPGDNHWALYQAKLIPDPYYATNESQVQWVGESDWYIERQFLISDTDLAHEVLQLTLSRVDTFAQIWVNQRLVLNCGNMFRQYQVDIKPYLRQGNNHIQIRFSRADVVGQQLATQQPFYIPWAKGNNQIPYMNLVRKVQCHSGWDWGICLMVSGIYDSIKIEPISQSHLGQIRTSQQWQDDGSVLFCVEVEYRCQHPCQLQVAFDQHNKVQQVSSSGNGHFSFQIEAPKLWWPVGYGAAYLYDLTITLGNNQLSKRIGLRQLQLNTKADALGSAMEFQINGFPISAKGANWIPVDAMPSLATSTRYRALLQSAVDANMNMIRVWGGGQYECDEFYQLCDELGIMVWQDMMFACALYPSNPGFVDEVEHELRYQIRRLRDHACVALWCGDNEVIGALNWYDESKANRDRYVVNYDRLSRTLAQIVMQEDPSRVFWPSSPCNGDLDYGDAWHDDSKGDMHFWDVWHSNASFDAYLGIKPRFCSEFGFQSWPSFAEIKRFVPEQDWNITSPTFESHQKNSRGNSIITEMFTRYFRFPNGFEQMLYLSQVQQAIAIKTGCEYWRAMSPVCRGLLYWQLNDNWPVSSWSSLEYSGRWKQLHYHAKRFFSPTYGAFLDTENSLKVQLINDSRNTGVVTGVATYFDYHGEELNGWEFAIEVDADSNNCALDIDKRSLTHIGFIHLQVQAFGQRIENTWFASTKFKQLPIQDTQLKWQIVNNQIVITADKPAFFVHLECDGNGRFSDSSFTLIGKKTVSYSGELEELASLRIYHLAASYVAQ